MSLLEKIEKAKAEKGQIEAVARDSQGNVIVNPFVRAARENRLPVQRPAPLEGR